MASKKQSAKSAVKKAPKKKKSFPTKADVKHAERRGELRYDAAAVGIAKGESTWAQERAKAEAAALSCVEKGDPKGAMAWRAMTLVIDKNHPKEKKPLRVLPLSPFPQKVAKKKK